MVQIATSTKIAFALLGIGFLFFLIGFCAPYWHLHKWENRVGGEKRSIYYGIWRYCIEEQKYRASPYDFCYNMVSTTYGVDYVRATQFFETVGFLAALVSLVLLILAVCIVSCKNRKILPILSAVFSIVAAGCILLGAIIFGAQDYEKYYLSWAFALTIIGGIFFGVAGVLILVATIVMNNT